MTAPTKHHLSAYGQWAGYPRGTPCDPERCAEEVFGGIWHSHQCTRKRGHGPDGAFCKQHAKRFERKAE